MKHFFSRLTVGVLVAALLSNQCPSAAPSLESSSGRALFTENALSAAVESARHPFNSFSVSMVWHRLSNRPETPFYSKKREVTILVAAFGVFAAWLGWLVVLLTPWSRLHPAGLVSVHVLMGFGRVGIGAWIAHRMLTRLWPAENPIRFDWRCLLRFMNMSLQFGAPIVTFLIYTFWLPRFFPNPWARFLFTAFGLIPVQIGVTFYVMYRFLYAMEPRQAEQNVATSSIKALGVLAVFLSLDVFLATLMRNLPLANAAIASLGGLVFNLALILPKHSKPLERLERLNRVPPFSWLDPYYRQWFRLFKTTSFGFFSGFIWWTLFGSAMIQEGHLWGGTVGRWWIGVGVASGNLLMIREVWPWIMQRAA